MYAFATFFMVTALLIGLPQLLQFNQQPRQQDLQAQMRLQNLYTFHQGAVSYQQASSATGALANASIVPAYVPTFYQQYAPGGTNAWAAQARTYNARTLVVTYGSLGGVGGAESFQRDVAKSALCGFITGGALIAPRAGVGGQIYLGPASSPAINFNTAPWSIADGNYACARMM